MSRWVAVVTLRDPGAARAAADALEQHGIAVECKTVGTNPYFGTVTGVEIEVRVPPERQAEAEGVLGQFAVESEAALRSQAPAWSADEQAVADALREAPPPRRLKSRALGLVYSICVPVLGPIYADSPGLALASVLVHIPLLVMLWRGGFVDAGTLTSFWLLGRMVDVLGTQQALARHNALLDGKPDPDAAHAEHSDDTEAAITSEEGEHAP